MIVIYTPATGSEERFASRTLKVSEVSIVSKTIDQTWPQIRVGLIEGDLDAMRGIAWVLKKRTQPSLRFGEFDPGVHELISRFDEQEVADFCREIAAADGTAEEVDAAYSELIDHAADREAAEKYVSDFRAQPGGGE